MRREVGSITEIAPGVFRVSVSVGFNSKTGRRRRPSRTIRGTDRDAEIALARLLLEAGRLPETDITVRQYLLDMYLPHVEKRCRRRTVDGYRSKIENHIIGPLGDVHLLELTPYVLDRWIDAVEGSPRTRRHVYRVLGAALNLAVRWRLIEANPLRAVEAPPVPETRKPDVLSEEEAVAYLEAFRGHQIEALIVTALGAGLRRSELAGLTWADFDFWSEQPEDGPPIDRCKVWVRRGLHDRKGVVIEELPKSVTSQRGIQLPDWAVVRLKQLRGIGPLVVEDGAPMRPCRISDEYKRQVRAKKLRYVQLKNLRHSHACMALDKGADLYSVSRRLGHSSVAVTEAFYVKPSERADREIADVLGTLGKPAPSRAKSHSEPSRRT